MKISYAAAAAASILCSTAFSDAVYDEAIDGDLSGDPTAPTPIALDGDTLTVSGSVQAFSGGDTRDYFTFTVGESQTLSAVRLVSYLDGDSPGIDGNTGFIMIATGDTTVIPTNGTRKDFLGGRHLNRNIFPDDTVNVLDGMSSGKTGGVGFDLPLDSGTYTMNVQQTGFQLTLYTIRLEFDTASDPCPTDFNGDNTTDGADLGTLLSGWGQNPCEYDLTGDGFCDGADLGVFLSAWGGC